MPFAGDDVIAVFATVLKGEAPSARTYNPDVSAAFDEWFRRACAADPEVRFGDAQVQMVRQRPLHRSLVADHAEAVVVLRADGHLRGGDRGDAAVVQFRENGKIVIQPAAGHDADPQGGARRHPCKVLWADPSAQPGPGEPAEAQHGGWRPAPRVVHHSCQEAVGAGQAAGGGSPGHGDDLFDGRLARHALLRRLDAFVRDLLRDAADALRVAGEGDGYGGFSPVSYTHLTLPTIYPV